MNPYVCMGVEGGQSPPIRRPCLSYWKSTHHGELPHSKVFWKYLVTKIPKIPPGKIDPPSKNLPRAHVCMNHRAQGWPIGRARMTVMSLKNYNVMILSISTHTQYCLVLNKAMIFEILAGISLQLLRDTISRNFALLRGMNLNISLGSSNRTQL